MNRFSKSLVTGFSLVLVGGAVAGGSSACTKQQGAILETGIPVDMTAIGCVISVAVSSGLSLGLVASQCGVSLEKAAEILYEAVTLKPDAGVMAMAKVSPLAKTNAALDAAAWKREHP